MRAVSSLPHRTPNCHTSLSFCTWYFLTSRVPGFRINTSCIKSIKASYKAKLDSKKRVRRMTEYQEAERETTGKVEMEPRREVSRTGATTTEPKPRVIASKEQSTRRSQQVMAKRPRGSTSRGEPSPKKANRGSEARASTQMSEVVSPGAEEQEEEEEEEEEAVPTLHSRGLVVEAPRS